MYEKSRLEKGSIRLRKAKLWYIVMVKAIYYENNVTYGKVKDWDGILI